MLILTCQTPPYRFINEEYSSICEEKISFLCPYCTCTDEIKCSTDRAIAYMRDAFFAKLMKGIAQSKFILTPYHQKYVLLIISF